MKNQKRSAIVFLMNYSGHPIQDALRYGTIVPLTQGDQDFRNTDRVAFNVKRILAEHEFNYKTDYIALMSSPVLATVIIRILRDVPTGKLKCLVFDNKKKVYSEREL